MLFTIGEPTLNAAFQAKMVSNPRTTKSSLDHALRTAVSDCWNLEVPVPSVDHMDELVLLCRAYIQEHERADSIDLKHVVAWLKWFVEVWAYLRPLYPHLHRGLFPDPSSHVTDTASQTESSYTPRSMESETKDIPTSLPAIPIPAEPVPKGWAHGSPVIPISASLPTAVTIHRPLKTINHPPVRHGSHQGSTDFQTCGQCGELGTLVYPINACPKCIPDAKPCKVSSCNVMLSGTTSCPVHKSYTPILCNVNAGHGMLQDGICVTCHPEAQQNKCCAVDVNGTYFCTGHVWTARSGTVHCIPHHRFFIRSSR